MRRALMRSLVLSITRTANLNQKLSNGVPWNKPCKMGYGIVSQVVQVCSILVTSVGPTSSRSRLDLAWYGSST